MSIRAALVGPFRVGRLFYAERSPRVAGLKLFGHWVYSRAGNTSCLSLRWLVRWRVGDSVSWEISPRDHYGYPRPRVRARGREGGGSITTGVSST